MMDVLIVNFIVLVIV